MKASPPARALREFDCFSEYTFPGVEQAVKAQEYMLTPGGKALAEDELNFLDMSYHPSFGVTETLIAGAPRGVEPGLAGKVAFVGFDSSPKMTDAMAKGHMDATVVQDPVSMGYQAVRAMVDHLAGRQVPKRVDTGATLITRATMGTPEAQALLNPDFKKWLKE